MRKLILVLMFSLVVSGNALAQDDESKGFVRVGVGSVNFTKDDYIDLPAGEPHYHEAALTANFSAGYGTDMFRVMVLFDPAIVDGVKGTSIHSLGVKGEVGVPWIGWLKFGGGAMLSNNHAKLSDDIKIYEMGPRDYDLVSPFGSITFLPRSEYNRFFADVRVGRTYGGKVLSLQTGEPIANIYVSVSLGVHVKLHSR